MPRGARATSRDVAARAGVSVATVSYVVNGRAGGRVGHETAERVRDAARALGYVPNASARGLKRRRTERVCLVIGSIGVPAHDRLAADLHAVAEESGHGVLTLVVNSRERATQASDLLRQQIADGAVITAPSEVLADLRLDLLVRSGLALVVMDNKVRPDGFDVVRTPDRTSCGLAFDHLFGSGRRRVAFVGHRHDIATPADSERLGAYLDALERDGVERDDRLITTGADDRISGYRAAERLVRSPEPPDAIFAASDRSAISTIWAVRDAGLTVPDDVAVVGVGNVDEGAITRPPLSTVGPQTMDFGVVVRMLFERLAACGGCGCVDG